MMIYFVISFTVSLLSAWFIVYDYSDSLFTKISVCLFLAVFGIVGWPIILLFGYLSIYNSRQKSHMAVKDADSN